MQDEFLIEYMNEHYAHSRDHEHLRAQITSIMSASSSVLIGLVAAPAVGAWPLIGVGFVVIVLSALNFQLNRLHQNRADAHAKVAGSIREDFQLRLWGHATAIAGSPEFFREKFRTIKRGNLELTWNYVPVFFGLAGFGLVILGACELAGCCKP